MTIITLGINFGWHESSATFVVDGKVVFAAAEERYSRVKQDSSFPVLAVGAGLKYLSIDASCVDCVALSWPLDYSVPQHDLKLFVRGDFARSKSRAKKILAGALTSGAAKRRFESKYLASFSRPKIGFHYCDHHESHAMSVAFMSEERECTAVIFDGRGTTESTSIWSVRDNSLTKLFERQFPDSIGVMYAAATELLGFQPFADEWKVMGLAAYGSPNVDLSPFFSDRPDELIPCGRAFIPGNDNGQSTFAIAQAAFRRAPDAEIEQKHMDFAASVQLACEEAMLRYAKRAVELGGNGRLALAGGVALNCKANGEVLRLEEVESLIVQPAAGDDGTSIGAALIASRDVGSAPLRCADFMPYLGREYSDDEIEGVLRRAKLTYRRVVDIGEEVAERLAGNELVGWFQGRMEFGPRALGNRSILASPCSEDNRDRVNEAVKFREAWRPFAPAVMHEYGNKYFEQYQYSPHMILSFWATEHAKQVIPAVVHKDGSSRVQSVTEQNNVRFHRLLSAFSNKTGVHVLMNTSFNLKGEPIVESPLDAVRTFYSSGLDCLAIGCFVVSKSADS
jgi:carbamoyltransferase